MFKYATVRDEFSFDTCLTRGVKERAGLGAAAERLPAIVAEAGQLYRQYAASDRGIDGEIEFKDANGQPSGQKLFLQLKPLETYYYQRKADGAEIFTIKREPHAVSWQELPFPVMLATSAPDGTVQWMDVGDYLKRQSARGQRANQIEFKGEPVTALSLRQMRDKLCSDQTVHWSSADLKRWAGETRIVTLAIVFTDVVGSTALAEQLGDTEWNAVRRKHFTRGRDVLARHGGFLIKTIGDSLMVVFRSAAAALDFANELRRDPGDGRIQLRQVGHIGPVTLEEDDVFGRHVNLAARVAATASPGDLLVTDAFKRDVDCIRDPKHRLLSWEGIKGVSFKGFSESFDLWRLK